VGGPNKTLTEISGLWCPEQRLDGDIMEFIESERE
jgi:hypothetical protein